MIVDAVNILICHACESFENMNNYVSFFHTMLATNTVSRRNVNPDRRIHSLGFRRTEAEFMGNIGPQWVCDVNAVDQTPCGVRATEVCVPTVCGTRVTDATPDQLAFSLAPMKDKDIVGRDDSVSHDLSLLAAQMLEMGVHNAWDEMSDIIMRLKEDPTFELTPAIVSRAAVAPGFPPTAQAFWDVISNSTNQPTRLTYDDITQLDQTGTPMVYYFVWVYSACIRFRTGGSSRLNTPIEVETTTRSLASKFPAAVAFIATVEGMSCHDYMLDLETLIVGSRDRNCPFRAERSFDPAADTPPPGCIPFDISRGATTDASAATRHANATNHTTRDDRATTNALARATTRGDGATNHTTRDDRASTNATARATTRGGDATNHTTRDDRASTNATTSATSATRDTRRT